MPAKITPTNGGPNALNGSGSKPKTKPAYDPSFTDRVIAATGPKAHPRVAEIMPSLLRHLHDFAREVDLTVAEWSAAVDFVSSLSPLHSCHSPKASRTFLPEGANSNKVRSMPRGKCRTIGATRHSSSATS